MCVEYVAVCNSRRRGLPPIRFHVAATATPFPHSRESSQTAGYPAVISFLPVSCYPFPLSCAVGWLLHRSASVSFAVGRLLYSLAFCTKVAAAPICTYLIFFGSGIAALLVILCCCGRLYALVLNHYAMRWLFHCPVL